ncbi:dienelactone hydrolase family protein [Sphingobium sp. Sx8-8]|uniref:dienelactone hydrolase family protein n=1 Tax=Sphingobium sp. Sx8-8 TaxID=2933617 RepID=UPI001F59B0B9|nr:dienelactone hydrolase family protein [Sphingobium sp. Sx8-8]
MQERTIDVAVGEGVMTTFITHPDREGPHPLVLFQMDAAGIREELRDMARRLATSGYYVMLPNLFHRSGVLEIPDAGMDEMAALLAAVNRAGVLEDCAALLAVAEGDDAADCRRIGTVGYCMTGQYAVQLAAAWPDRVAAAASFHGVALATDAPDSPHRVMRRATAEFYFGHAELDGHAPMEMALAVRDAIATDGIQGEMEIYPGLDHGFVFPERKAGLGAPRPPYDRDGDLRHWERLIALFRRTIG